MIFLHSGTYMLLGMVRDENCVNTKTAFHLVGVFSEGNDTGQIPVILNVLIVGLQIFFYSWWNKLVKSIKEKK